MVLLAPSVCPLVDEADGSDWCWEKLGFVPVHRILLSKTLIFFC